MFSRIRHWYNGKDEIHLMPNDPGKPVVIAPMLYTKRHWSAKIARTIVTFYLRHWKWLWLFTVSVIGVWAAACRGLS
jgi:hypothetical protein